MTSFQSRTLATVHESFGFGEFTGFDAATVLETTLGNIQPTLARLVKTGHMTSESGFYKINKEATQC